MPFPDSKIEISLIDAPVEIAISDAKLWLPKLKFLDVYLKAVR